MEVARQPRKGSSPKEVGLGVIGCGGFGLFALQHFTQVPGVTLVGMAGTHRPAALAAARRFGVDEVESIDKLVQRDDVDLVYIATPPFLHYEQALAALDAGKHVICEKPLAVTLLQADEMLRRADGAGLLLVANLMQRYNPLFDIVRRLIESGPLGEVLHGYFENYAADEGLPLEHWFWDREKSGGIFVEHGVHFFDLFAGWLGAGKVVAAQKSQRTLAGTAHPSSSSGSAEPSYEIEDQVQCAVRYGDQAIVNFYHGFHQPGRLDRQELRLVFERGDVTLYEWIPTRVKIHAVASEADTRTLCDLFPQARLDVSDVYPPNQRVCRGRNKEIDVYQKLELSWGDGQKKMYLYGELLRALMQDQLAWIRDRSHVRRMTGQNGRDSLAVAVAADRLARDQRSMANDQ